MGNVNATNGLAVIPSPNTSVGSVPDFWGVETVCHQAEVKVDDAITQSGHCIASSVDHGGGDDSSHERRATAALLAIEQQNCLTLKACLQSVQQNRCGFFFDDGLLYHRESCSVTRYPSWSYPNVGGRSFWNWRTMLHLRVIWPIKPPETAYGLTSTFLRWTRSYATTVPAVKSAKNRRPSEWLIEFQLHLSPGTMNSHLHI